MSEFFSEKAISGREEVYRVCQKYSDKHFSEKELLLIKLADTGLTTQLIRSLMDQIDHYNYEEISNFYLCTLFEMLKINKGIIEKTFQRASVLFKSLNIKIDGLYVSLEK